MFNLVQLRTHRAYKWLIVVIISLALFSGLGVGQRSDAKSFVGATSPAWSPDGQHIAFMRAVPSSADGSTSDLYVINANGDGAVKLGSGQIYNPLWSPDDTQLLVEHVYTSAQQYVSTGLDVINVATATTTTVTNDGYEASWSANGKQVYFIRDDGKLYNVNVHRASSTESELHTVLPDRLPTMVGYVWSPDSKRLAFVNQPDPQNAYDFAFYLVNADGTGLHQFDTGAVATLAWSPNSEQLATLSDCGGHSGLCLFNTDGSGMRSLVEDRTSSNWSSALAWSPNGQWIAYVHKGQLAIISPHGSNRGVLTSTSASGDTNVFAPSWSADSRRIVFQAQYVFSRITGDPLIVSELYVVNVDGMNLTLLQGLDTLW